MWKYFSFPVPCLPAIVSTTAGFLSFAPLLAFAATGQVDLTNVIPDLANSQGGTGSGAVINWVQSFYKFSLLGGVFLAVGVITWAGLKYALAAGNPSGQSDARDQILQALLGLLLLFGAYLILFTINPNLINLSLPTLSSVSVPMPVVTSQGTTTGGSGSALAIELKIATAAAAYRYTDTSGGPGNGTVACAWAVNNVLANAGIAPLDSNSVQSMENTLTSGRGTLVDSSAALPGDIVIQANDRHVGICYNNGCTQVISNSSGQARFNWISNTSFSDSGGRGYNDGPGRIYRLNN